MSPGIVEIWLDLKPDIPIFFSIRDTDVIVLDTLAGAIGVLKERLGKIT